MTEPVYKMSMYSKKVEGEEIRILEFLNMDGTHSHFSGESILKVNMRQGDMVNQLDVPFRFMIAGKTIEEAFDNYKEEAKLGAKAAEEDVKKQLRISNIVLPGMDMSKIKMKG